MSAAATAGIGTRSGFPARAIERHQGATILVLTLLSAVTASVAIGRESLWLDEAYSLLVAELPFDRFLDLMVDREIVMVPYYLLLRAWMALGDDPGTLRLLSVLPAVASVPLLFVLTRRLFDVLTASLAGLLLALSPFAVTYAQEARGYSLVMLLVLASTWLFVRSVGSGGAWRWVAYVVVSVLAVAVHFFAGLVIVAHVASLPFLRSRPSIRTLAAVYGAILVSTTPLLVGLLSSGNQRDWIPDVSVRAVAKAGAALVGGRTVPGAAILVVVSLIALAMTLREALRRIGEREHAWPLVLTLAWAGIPVAASVLISLARPVFVERYLIVALPAILVGIAVGALRLRTPWATVVVATLLAVSAWQLIDLYVVRDKEDWTQLARTVVEGSEPGDAVVFFRPLGKVPWSVAVSRLEPDADANLAPGLPVADWRAGDLTNPRELDAREVAAALADQQRVWLILSHTPQAPADEVRGAFEGFRLVERMAFSGASVELYERA